MRNLFRLLINYKKGVFQWILGGKPPQNKQTLPFSREITVLKWNSDKWYVPHHFLGLSGTLTAKCQGCFNLNSCIEQGVNWIQWPNWHLPILIIAWWMSRSTKISLFPERIIFIDSMGWDRLLGVERYLNNSTSFQLQNEIWFCVCYRHHRGSISLTCYYIQYKEIRQLRDT